MKFPLYAQILGAIVLALIAGSLCDPDTTLLSLNVVSIFEFMGTLFLNGLKMVIVPLVLSSIICGMTGMSSGDNVGRMGGKALGFYMMSSLLAILVGLAVVNVLQPGIIEGKAASEVMTLPMPDNVDEELAKVGGKGSGDVVDVFLRMVPPNIVQAAADGQMLGLIFFGILFGFFMMKIEESRKNTMLSFWEGVSETMTKITMFIMKFAPYGVFGLVAKTVVATDIGQLGSMLGWFFFTVVVALSLHTFVTMPVLLKFLGRINPIKQFQAMVPALLTAFSTASSSGTLPVTMDCVQNKGGVSKETTSFVLPLGATINMDGTALYECVAAMFIAQAYGLELSLTIQFTIVLVALLTSIGVAGIPSASLVAITIILGSIGLPLEGIGLLMVTDRVLDMFRTSVNVFSDSCCATIIARTEGEETNLR